MGPSDPIGNLRTFVPIPYAALPQRPGHEKMAIREANPLGHYAPRPADGDHRPPSAWRELGTPVPPKPRLLDRVRQAIGTRHYSRRTKKAHQHWIKRYIVFHGKRQPAAMDAAEDAAFLTSLAVSWQGRGLYTEPGSQRLALSLSGGAGHRIAAPRRPRQAKRPVHLPVVLTREQVRAVLQRLRPILLVAAVSICTVVSVAHSQPGGRVPRVGYLSPASASDPTFQHGRDLFLLALRELGYAEGQSVAIEYRWAEGKYEWLPRLAAELVRAKVDVIVATGGAPPARAAQQATRTIPIVIGGAVDPVGAGLVASLARPGGNMTGLTLIPDALVGKQLELLMEVVPAASRIAVLWNPDNPGNARQLRAAEAVPRLRLEPVAARSSAEIEKAFAMMTQRRPDGFVVLLDTFFLGERGRIADLAMRNRLPGVYGYRLHADDGGLMAYGANRVELAKQTAFYVARILKGAKPADLPVTQPTKFELVINLKTAKALGLKIPQPVLLRADEIIDR